MFENTDPSKIERTVKREDHYMVAILKLLVWFPSKINPEYLKGFSGI